MNGRLVNDFPFEFRRCNGELAFQKALHILRKIGGLIKDKIYVFGLGCYVEAVQVIPDETSNRTCADAPRAEAEVPCRSERLHGCA